MPQSSERQKSLVTEAAVRYSKALEGSPAAEFLESRGLPTDSVTGYRFGFVADPVVGHEAYRGMLAIPYIRVNLKAETTVATLRFRCLKPGCLHKGHGKYNTLPGAGSHLYNTVDIGVGPDRIAIAEGELDAVTASLAGIPCVALAGANVWKDYYRRIFEGFEAVYVLADGDDAGQKLMTTVCESLPNAVPAMMPPGLDVNDYVRANGPQALKERIGW